MRLGWEVPSGGGGESLGEGVAKKSNDIDKKSRLVILAPIEQWDLQLQG